MMQRSILSTDVGSLPFKGDLGKFLEARRRLEDRLEDELLQYFKPIIVNSFIDKSRVIDLPTYPQFAPMDDMFLQLFDGIKKVDGGYEIVGDIKLLDKPFLIPEVEVIKQSSRIIYEEVGRKVEMKICITGPYTLSFSFVDRAFIDFFKLGDVLSKIVERSIFKNEYVEVSMLTLDEPSLGVVDDDRLDYGRAERELLLKAWDVIFRKAKSRSVETGIHLHSTSNNIFWDVDSLNVIESHTEDYIYASPKIKQTLERTDKFLKVSICKTNPDELIMKKLRETGVKGKEIYQRLGDVWKEIKEGKCDPSIFLEDQQIMKKRLEIAIRNAGDRVLYAGPECGLGSFFTYDCAIELLRRVTHVVKSCQI